MYLLRYNSILSFALKIAYIVAYFIITKSRHITSMCTSLHLMRLSKARRLSVLTVSLEFCWLFRHYMLRPFARHFNVVLTWIPPPPSLLKMFPVESRKHENKKVAILNGQYSIYLLSGTWTLFGGQPVDPWWYLYNGICIAGWSWVCVCLDVCVCVCIATL